MFRGELEQSPAVVASGEIVGKALEPGLVYEAHLESRRLDGTDQWIATFFESHDLVGGLQEGLVGAGVEPGGALRQELHVELSPFEIGPVHIGNLQLTTG